MTSDAETYTAEPSDDEVSASRAQDGRTGIVAGGANDHRWRPSLTMAKGNNVVAPRIRGDRSHFGHNGFSLRHHRNPRRNVDEPGRQPVVFEGDNFGRPPHGRRFGSDQLVADHQKGPGRHDVELDRPVATKGAQAPGTGQGGVDAKLEGLVQGIDIVNLLSRVGQPRLYKPTDRYLLFEQGGEHPSQMCVVRGVDYELVALTPEFSAGSDHDHPTMALQLTAELGACGSFRAQQHGYPVVRAGIVRRFPTP